MSLNDPSDLKRIYEARFGASRAYRTAIWSVLLNNFFQQYIKPDDAVLDLGCGYGEFINQVRCGKRYAMDLNPHTTSFLDKSVVFCEQDCSKTWQLPDKSLNVVFTSNFFEHLPDKPSLGRTLDEAKRCLVPGGRLIALGPNIKHLPGLYWEFSDHCLPLTENSLAEALKTRGYKIDVKLDKFLPYTMVYAPQYPTFFLKAYLAIPPIWRLMGKQFLVVASKP